MDQVDYEALTEKLGEVTLQNKQLKDEAAKEWKPHYKNGRRGSKFNG